LNIKTRGETPRKKTKQIRRTDIAKLKKRASCDETKERKIYINILKITTMKKTILASAALLFAGFLMAASPKYYQKMGETLPKFGACKTIDDYQSLANQFNLIANAETQEWLPLYYEAQCYILMSFRVDDNPAKKDEYLDIAEVAINKMLVLAPNESEAYTLQAFYCMGRLVVNPQERGQKYGGLSGQAVGRALGMEPENPRAQLMQLQNELGTARFFGSDTKPFLIKAQTLLDNWDNYKNKSSLHPQWGKDQVEGIVKSLQG